MVVVERVTRQESRSRSRQTSKRNCESRNGTERVPERTTVRWEGEGEGHSGPERTNTK